jgi:3-methyl-2-oxobutanoate hydroxymethyltransferase
VRRLVECGIPVVGHLGFTPQSVLQLGGARVQGRVREVAADMLADALALEQAGAFLLVLELVPTPLAGLLSRRLAIPTIGIGAGPECDGQVQVISDVLGLYPDFLPRHARHYANVADTIRSVASDYLRDVQQGAFPTAANSSEMDPAILEGLDER